MSYVPIIDVGTISVDFAAASAALASSSTSLRTEHLSDLDVRLSRDALDEPLVPDLLELLFRSYAIYQDRDSREGVQGCLTAILKKATNPDIISPIVSRIQATARKPGIAASDAFALVEWCTVLTLQLVRRTLFWKQLGSQIVVAHAIALERCVRPGCKKGIVQSAIRLTRRALRSLLAAETADEPIHHLLPGTVRCLSQNVSSPGTVTSRNAIYLGIIAGVATRSRSPMARPAFALLTPEYVAYYNKEVIGSSTPVAPHIASSFQDFFSGFVSSEKFEDEVGPSLAKGLLRAPEVVLKDVLVPLVASLPQSYDLSHVLSRGLLKPILSNVKSSSPEIRAGAVSALRSILPRCHNVGELELITDEIVSPLIAGKISSPEQRIIHAQMLASLPPNDQVSERIMSAFAAVASKEGNDAALAAEVMVLASAASRLLKKNMELKPPVLDVFANGLSDKKPSARRTWILSIGDLLLSVVDSDAVSAAFVEFILPKMMDVFQDVVANPFVAAQNTLLVGGFVCCGLSRTLRDRFGSSLVIQTIEKALVPNKCLVLKPKPSFLLNHRLYTKLASDDDLKWLCRALTALIIDLVPAPPAVQLAWAEAFIYLIGCPSVAPRIRQEASRNLSRVYAWSPEFIAALIIDGLSEIIVNTADSTERWGWTPSTEDNNLLTVLKAICLTPEESIEFGYPANPDIVPRQLCNLIVLARPGLIHRASWIELCLRMDIDPAHLADLLASDLVLEIVSRSTPPLSPRVTAAAWEAAAELVFVAPKVMTSHIVQLIKDDLQTDIVKEIGPLECAVMLAPEGTLAVDVLAKIQLAKLQSVPDKNTKDYELLKWEEYVRTKLQAKKGGEVKLTSEEQMEVKNQLRKESEIRESMVQVTARLHRGFSVIQRLARGPPTECPHIWLEPALNYLLAALDAGAHKITSSHGAEAFISCSQLISSRLGSTRPFIGAATLRSRNINALPAQYLEEPLEPLLTRVLYRLRFVGEQRPLDRVSFAYILPLLLHVLRTGGLGQDSEERDAQLILVIEILSYHAEICADELMSRVDILVVLIASMRRYPQHYKILRDCFADTCRCMAPNMTTTEISALARGCIVPETSVRTTVLQSISAEVDMSEMQSFDEIWLSCHDDEAENRGLGREIWDESGFEISEDLAFNMMPYLREQDSQLRNSAAKSLAEAASRFPDILDRILLILTMTYNHLAKPQVPRFDAFGIPIKVDLTDRWEGRHGVGLTLQHLAPQLFGEKVGQFFDFLIEAGPLSDHNSGVRSEMIKAGMGVIACHGKDVVDELMGKFEKTLKESNQNSTAADLVDEAVIIMYGALAGHLKPGDARIPPVIERLLDNLATPSESVQYAIAECLPPLTRANKDQSSDYCILVIDRLMASKDYATRRGNAYGLAGLVHGRGICVLKDYRIMTTLRAAAENKKESNQREAAFLAFELLSTILGRLLEPYVIQTVPLLLTGFGDGNANVRDACLEAAKACFARLTSFGVKKIMPILLDGLGDQQWRSKKGACELLGAMAYLDPQQLAQSLPSIIPPLTDVLSDSHKEVRAAANKSLKRFGDVIQNPEIKSVVGILLKALSDPTKYTDDALDSLIKVQFVHYLDSPSLALVICILQRGLADRSNTKRKASQVIGSLAHLTERKDLTSHLPVLVAGLKIAAVDPVPTTRATASRALGSLIEKLGEDAMPDLIPSLMHTLKSETGAGDMLGSAQALSEVLAGLGTSKLEETLQTILQNVQSSKPAVREGFMSLFIFLPICFGNSFASFLGKIIPSILAGLADDVESIREIALRAGRLIVKNFASRAVDLLLPELERGLADDSYRIRHSSVELVGDLLFNLTGISAKIEAEDDEIVVTGDSSNSLRDALGDEKRNKILSALYVCRCDTAPAVRATAIMVWKALVPNPRMLKELTPTLTHLIVRRLGSPNMEHRMIASNALGEFIRKAGDSALSSLLPTLEDGLRNSTDPDTKQGICLALKELIASATTEALMDHDKVLISVVRTALTDAQPDIREIAAEAFDSLQQMFGKRAVDQVLPFLLDRLRSDGDADHALSALLTLLTDKTRVKIILPILLPTLMAQPMTSFNARALASLVRVAGAVINRRLTGIIMSLMVGITSSDPTQDQNMREELERALDTVILSVDEFDGLNVVLNVLLQLLRHEGHQQRAQAALHLSRFFASSNADFSRYNEGIVRALLLLFNDPDHEVVKAAWGALNEFTKRLRKEEMESLVMSTHQGLLHIGGAGGDIPGFELPKGINAVLPIFLQGLMNGTSEQRVQSAQAISVIIARASEASLKPFITQITGPLIRVVSERSTEVKAAVLLTLNNLLDKTPIALKPFLPQLQRTFTKALADPSSTILRTRASKALGTLIKYTPRVEPLIAELVMGLKTPDMGVRSAMLNALYEVMSKAGCGLAEASRSVVLTLIDNNIDRDEASLLYNARLMGLLIGSVPEEMALGLLKSRVLTNNFSHASALALNSVLVDSPNVILNSPLAGELPDLMVMGMMNRNPSIVGNFILATGKYLLGPITTTFESSKKLFGALSKAIQPGGPTDLRRLALVVVRTASRLKREMVRPHLALLALPVFSGVRDSVIPVKLGAEAAFVELFAIADEESRVFDKFMASHGESMPDITKRGIQDYFKRVGLRLGAQARERREAEGGQGTLGLSNDEVEDEKEIWSIGKLAFG